VKGLRGELWGGSRRSIAESLARRDGWRGGREKENGNCKMGGEGSVRTSWGLSVTKDPSTDVVTLSIVNYMVHHSNGWAFERKVISNQRLVIGSEEEAHPKTQVPKTGTWGTLRIISIWDGELHSPVGERLPVPEVGHPAIRPIIALCLEKFLPED
jgi:hypothetical protein